MRSTCWAARCTGSWRRWPPRGCRSRSGTLAGELRQVAPLLAPWAQAIAAHGRLAGHAHCDETSWQVFEDVADKENHRWWLWVFAAPRGAVSYRSRSGQGWEEVSLDLMAYSGPKG